MSQKYESFKLNPAGSGDIDPYTISTIAGAFVNVALKAHKEITLVVWRGDSSQSTFLVMPAHKNNKLIADSYASSLGSTATGPHEPIDLSQVESVHQLSVPSSTGLLYNTQANADPSQIAQIVAQSLQPNSWIAFTFRTATRMERNRYSTWFRFYSGPVKNHSSQGTSAHIVSIWAGGQTHELADGLIETVAQVMPGFDLEHRSIRGPRGLEPYVAAVIALAAWAGLTFVAHNPIAGAVIGGAIGSLVALMNVGVLPTKRSRLMAGLANGVAPAAPHLAIPPRAPKKERVTPDGQFVPERTGAYPLASTALLLAAHQPLLLTSPHAGGIAGATSTKTRAVPPIMRERIGSYMGVGDGNTPVYLSSEDRHGGLFAIGRQGSGKTEFLMSLYGFDCLDRITPSGLPGSVGPNHTIVAFETKGEGALKYQAFAQAAGDTATLIELDNPSTWGIDMFSVPGSYRQRGDFFASALRYVLGESSIGAQSFMALGSYSAAAMALVEDEQGLKILEACPHTTPSMSEIDIIYLLLGGQGDEASVSLYGELTTYLASLEREGKANSALAQAKEALDPFHVKVTPSRRAEIHRPPLNKVYALKGIETWWDRSRKKVTWDQIVNSHSNVVINAGAKVSHLGFNQQPLSNTVELNSTTSDEATTLFSGLLLYTLQKAIERNCTGWRDSGRAITIYADELSTVAGHSPDVIEWLHDKGRSFGVRKCFATQRPNQLDPQLLESLMDYSTIVAFRQSNAETAAPIIADISADGSSWEIADLINLPQYTAIVRAEVKNQRQRAFTFQAHYYAADLPNMATMQGFAPRG